MAGEQKRERGVAGGSYRDYGKKEEDQRKKKKRRRAAYVKRGFGENGREEWEEERMGERNRRRERPKENQGEGERASCPGHWFLLIAASWCMRWRAPARRMLFLLQVLDVGSVAADGAGHGGRWCRW